MANSDGAIIIDVNLNDKDYESRLSSMEGKTQSFGTQLKSLLSAVGITKAVSVGFNTLKDSVGSAMDRIDTMNQFNRVMTVMTGSTDKAQEALSALKEVTKGTAYGLDVAASSTQKLVTSGMQIDSATAQVKTWGDAVAFYGNGSNEQFSNVTDAISKMTSKGSVEMDQLNRLFDAGIPAVEIYADAMGMSTKEVQDALSSGKISAQEFTEGLTKAMQDGTGKFASIDGAAKEAGASWKATFDNAKAAVTRGMVEIIESIDKVLSDNGLPTMREMFAEIGKVAEQALGFVAEHLPELISLIQTLLPLVVSVGTAFTTWKVAGIVSNVTGSVSGLFTLMANGNGIANSLFVKLGAGGGIFSKLATSALSAGGGIMGLGKAFLTLLGGPAVIIPAVIAGIVAWLIYMWNTSDEFRQFWYDLWDGIVEWCSKAIDSIVEFFTVTIPQAWEDFKTMLGELGETIKQVFSDAWNGVISFFTETIPAWIQSVIDWFNKIPYFIGYMVGMIIGQFIQWGIDLNNFVTITIPAFINGVIAWFQTLPGKIWEWLCNAWEKVKIWGQEQYNTAKEWVTKLIDDVVEWFRSLPSKIQTWLSDTINKIKEWGSNLWNEGIAAAKNLIDSIVSTAQSLPGLIKDVGLNMVRGLWDGIVSAKDWVLGKISEFCDGVMDGIKDFFGIHSPSRLMRDMIGKMLPPGIAIGFEMAMPKAASDIIGEANDMMDDIQKEINLNSSDLSTGVNLEKNAKYSQQTSIINQFPKSFSLSGKGMQPIYLVLDDGTELAHALVEPLNRELALQ